MRDSFVLSKGHSAGALYTALWSLGRLGDDDLALFHRDETLLSGHPPAAGIPDIRFATGSLGHGLSLAAGTALGLKLARRAGSVYCMTSDGEWQEGSTWEALIFAVHHRLRNLTVLVDLNDLQGFGSTHDVASMRELPKRIESFDADVRVVDGHDPAAVRAALDAPSEHVRRRRPPHGQGQRRQFHGAPHGVALLAARRRTLCARARRDRRPMRQQLCDALVARAASNLDMIFITGDLGFMALEPLRAAMGERFINAGVAEQNMISVSAGLAAQGFEVWVYSIAPFCYARPFEQIRNDIAFHGLPVNLIGNGGGYGYGVMGPTHHAIEDYGVLLTLPNLDVLVPVFDEDVVAAVARAAALRRAVYLRLGRGEPPKGYAVPAYAPWRRLTSGGGAQVVAVGPLAGTYVAAFDALPPDERPNLWAVAELRLDDGAVPGALLDGIAGGATLVVVEEHVAHGGFASDLLLYLAGRGVAPRAFRHLHALAHHYPRYGSQPYLRALSKLDPDSVVAAVRTPRPVGAR